MINYVLASPSSCVSGRLLAKKISELQGRRCFYYGRRLPRSRRRERRVYIRYGSHEDGGGVCLNSRDAVDLASQKFVSLQVMRDAGVLVPDVAPMTGVHGKRRILRKHRHFAGSDNPLIVEANHELPESANQYDYALEFVKSKSEYRVHVLNGSAIRVQRKRRLDGHEDADHQIRSENRGWGLKIVTEYSPALVAAAVAAVQSLHLDFGAVDVLKTKDDKFYVLEVNTAPGLNENGAEIYARELIAYVSQRG